jgi:hypothetical protein
LIRYGVPIENNSTKEVFLMGQFRDALVRVVDQQAAKRGMTRDEFLRWIEENAKRKKRPRRPRKKKV